MARFKGNKDSVGSTTSEGEASAECMKVGQTLVDGNHLSAENLATALGLANGDLLQFEDLLMGRFGVGRADILEDLVRAAGELGQFVHRRLDDIGQRFIKRVGRFSRLEEHVGILRRAA